MMRYVSPLLAVGDIERSKAFYRAALGLEVVSDYGANITLTGGISLQTLASWCELIGRDESDITLGGAAGELYFEEDNLEALQERLEAMGVRFVHPAREHPWGQRALRFYDPDGHIIEVGESIVTTARRFAAGGMDAAAVAARMDVSLAEAESWLAQ